MYIRKPTACDALLDYYHLSAVVTNARARVGRRVPTGQEEPRPSQQQQQLLPRSRDGRVVGFVFFFLSFLVGASGAPPVGTPSCSARAAGHKRTRTEPGVRRPPASVRSRPSPSLLPRYRSCVPGVVACFPPPRLSSTECACVCARREHAGFSDGTPHREVRNSPPAR